jgi:hypothetical protein
MGRAFASTASPVDGGDKDVSYAVISWTCTTTSGSSILKVKWEPGKGFSTSGALPDCEGIGGAYADAVPDGLSVVIDPSDPTCILVDVPAASEFDCDGTVSGVTAWVKAGSSESSLEPCKPTGLNLNQTGQPACSFSAP